jgi:hypothetical protein
MMNDYFHCGQYCVFRRINDSRTGLIPPAARELCAFAVD